MNTRRSVWRAKHGDIPKGWLIYTLNGNPNDCRLENLAAIPRKIENPRVLIAPFVERIRNLERELMFSKGDKNGDKTK